MRVFMEETEGVEEIFDYSVIGATSNHKRQGVFLKLLKLRLNTKKGFEYVALVLPKGEVQIRYLRDRESSDPFHTGEKQEIGRNAGQLIMSFACDSVPAEEVREHIIETLRTNWHEIVLTSVQEEYNLRFVPPEA